MIGTEVKINLKRVFNLGNGERQIVEVGLTAKVKEGESIHKVYKNLNTFCTNKFNEKIEDFDAKFKKWRTNKNLTSPSSPVIAEFEEWKKVKKERETFKFKEEKEDG